MYMIEVDVVVDACRCIEFAYTTVRRTASVQPVSTPEIRTAAGATRREGAYLNLFHDLLLYAPISTIVSGVFSVITAHNLTLEKRGPTV